MKAWKIPEKPNRKITRRAFWQRVTDIKYSQLIEQAKTDSLLAARISILNGDESIWLDSPEYKAWFTELVEQEVFSEEEFNLIFG